MTVDDVLLKTFLLFVGLVVAAAASWLFIPLSLYVPVAIITGIVTIATVFFVAGRRSVSLPLIGLYVVAEGVMLGTFSLLFETQYPGIVMPAVIATFVTAFVFLGMYKFLGVSISGRMARVVTVAVIAYAGVAVLGFVLMLLGVNIGIFGIGPAAGPLAWLFAGIGVVLASASLFMDFQSIERGIEMGAPESESWRAAFGLVVTMVWLYTQIIRILSFFRD